MKQRFIIYTICVLLLSSLADPLQAQELRDAAGETGNAEGLIDFGLRLTDIDGSKEKFREYRELDNGIFLEEFRLDYNKPDSRAFLNIRIKDVLEEDEFYGISGGMHGQYRYKFFYNSIPHSYATGRLLFTNVGSNYLRIFDPVRQSLENLEQTRAERASSNPLADTTGEDAQAQAIVRGMFNAADEVTFKVVRKQTGFEYQFDITADVKTWLRVKSERRDGIKVISAGTYERFAQSGIISGTTNSHSGDRFLVSGAELAEPVDYLTTSVSAGTGIYKKTWLADVEYTFTDFKNEFSSLRWDNPFRISDAPATNAGDAAVNPSSNGFNRGRFASGQLALPPDSQSHDLTASGSVTLPKNGRLSASIGFGLISQDERFLPYTLNSAVSGTGGAPPDLTDPSILPARDLNGEVKTLSGSTSLTFKPADPLAVTAKYRYYRYDDDSSSILFPGYAAFGESYWRTAKNDVSGPNDAPVRNEPFSFTKQVADLSLDYHLSRPLTLIIDGGWEAWDFEELRLDSSDEYSIGAGIVYKPSRISTLKVAYKFADKNVDGYRPGNTAGNPEAVGLINYNWADRKRNKVEARYQVLVWETLTAGLSGQYYKDDYAKDRRFGLKEVKDYAAALDLAYSPLEVVTISTNYAREYRKDLIRNGAKDDSFNVTTSALDDPFTTDPFNPFNYWNTEIKDTVDTVGVGVQWQIIPEKLDVTANYNFSFSKTKFNNYNPNAGEALAATGQIAKLDNAIAQPWPDVINRYHEVTAGLTYAATRRMSVGLRYLYEWYKLNDFAWNNMSNYLAGFTAENSTKFVFANATYKEYEAHVASINMIYRF